MVVLVLYNNTNWKKTYINGYFVRIRKGRTTHEGKGNFFRWDGAHPVPLLASSNVACDGLLIPSRPENTPR